MENFKTIYTKKCGNKGMHNITSNETRFIT